MSVDTYMGKLNKFYLHHFMCCTFDYEIHLHLNLDYFLHRFLLLLLHIPHHHYLHYDYHQHFHFLNSHMVVRIYLYFDDVFFVFLIKKNNRKLYNPSRLKKKILKLTFLQCWIPIFNFILYIIIKFFFNLTTCYLTFG